MDKFTEQRKIWSDRSPLGRRRPAVLLPMLLDRLLHSRPFRSLRRNASASTSSLSSVTALPSAYPYPRTHTTLVVPVSVVQQRERNPQLFDDSPNSRPFHRPPLNRAIPTIPESRSNESIISSASQFTQRHSISGTTQTTTLPPKENPQKDNSVVIANRMAENLGAKYATNVSTQSTLISAVSSPSTSNITTTQPTTTPTTTESIMTPGTARKQTALITLKPSVSFDSTRHPLGGTKPTRLPKKVRTRTPSDATPSTSDPPKSPLMSVAHSVRSRLTKLGTRIGRATSRSPIRSSYSMTSMRRDQSDLDRTVPKSSSMAMTSRSVEFASPPPLPSSEPPEDTPNVPKSFSSATTISAQSPTNALTIISPRVASSIPRRLPTTTLIPSPCGVYPQRRIVEEDRLAAVARDSPILAIDSPHPLATPDSVVAPTILLRRNDELPQQPLENRPPPSPTASPPKTPKATARLIVRQPSEPAYQTQHAKAHRRTKSRDGDFPSSVSWPEGAESVKTTRSLKITAVTTEFIEETPKPSRHKKSSSVDISTRTPKQIRSSASAGKADEMRLQKPSFIPQLPKLRTIRSIRNRRAPLAEFESTRVANSPAVECPPSQIGEIPSARKRFPFWKSKAKTSTEKVGDKTEKIDKLNNNNNEEGFRTLRTARIITRTSEMDPNGNIQQNDRESRLGRLTLNELLASPLTSHRRTANTRAVLHAKHRSGLIDDEITDQPMLISTTLSLIDERSEGTPTLSTAADINENIPMDTEITETKTVRIRESESTIPTTVIHTGQPQKDDHAQIEKIIEELSGQLNRIREYAIEDEDEMKKLRFENDTLKEELEIKDRVIQLLMNRMNESKAVQSKS